MNSKFWQFSKKTSEDLLLMSTIKGIVGKKPKNIELYKLAVRHASVAKESNERLEFLGDAILGSIVAEYLFKKYPYKDEGFLTEIRSRIVKRESLNTLAMKIGLDRMLEFNIAGAGHGHRSLFGNALEAFIGALYLDHGYKIAANFVIRSLIQTHLDLHEIVQNNFNYKSILIEWAQKNGQKVKFVITNEEGTNHNRNFTAEVLIDDIKQGEGNAGNKKKAEQCAAEKACLSLGLTIEK